MSWLIKSNNRQLSPFYDLDRWQNEMDELFSNAFKGRGMPVRRADEWTPRIDVNITESDKGVKVIADVPGMDEKNIHISLHENMLTIEGEKSVEKEEKDAGYTHYERSYGRFCRQLMLPAEVDQDDVDATYKDGVLTINLKKVAIEQTKVKKIEVKKG